ncbi:hypothetical protein tpqmel_1023, partial [Candidatus Gastranaerophilus sp. (ex Termes propinquus)]
MKKPASINLINIFAICTLALTTFLCAGCGSLLTYEGDDLDKSRVKVVQTKESLVFSTYTKDSEYDNISARAGISKAPLQGVLVLYLELTNHSNEDFVFAVKDLDTKAQGQKLPMINPSDYINAYQGEQTANLASMQAMAPIGIILTTLPFK